MVIWNAHEFNSNESGRLTLFTVFITGSLFYYTYVGFLTSSLAVPNENIPFKSPEEILDTNYRYPLKFFDNLGSYQLHHNQSSQIHL